MSPEDFFKWLRDALAHGDAPHHSAPFTKGPREETEPYSPALKLPSQSTRAQSGNLGSRYITPI